MKSALFGLVGLLFLSIIGNGYAIENEYELEYDLLPKKIHEQDIVSLEVYKTMQGQASLEKIQDLKIESRDTTIVKIIGVEETHEYKTTVKLKAISEGKTTLYLFSEESQTLEIPITVNGNNIPKNISVDIFPDTFKIDKNNQGELSILLMDGNGIVTRADKDYLIKISVSKPGIISLSDTTAIISKGDFDVKQMVTVIDEGIVTITVKTDDLEDSKSLTVEEAAEREIEILVIPEDISSSNTSSGNMIAQLFSGGKLVKATEDITVFFEIKSSTDSETINTSPNINTLNPTGYFQIKKGQTYGHELFSIQKGETDEYTVTATSQDPLTIVEETFETIDVEIYGDEQVKFEPVSVLADGNRQLVGIIYLKDNNGHPVTADKNIVVPFTASDKSIFIENSIIKKGFDSALVFGNMGYFVPTNTKIAPNIQNSKVIDLDIQGFEEESVLLKTHVSTDHFLKGEQHWITLYIESPDGLFEIPDDQQFEISDSEIFQVDKDRIERHPYFILIPITAIDSGDDELVFSSDKFETTISLSSISSKPDSLSMDYSNKLFNGIKDTFTVQILNSQGLPVKINEDVDIKIFSSNPSIIKFPNNITISQESSFASLEIMPISSGTVEISLFSEGLPILTEEITVNDSTPTLQITSEDIINEGDSFIISILAKQNGVPLQNADITWQLEGGVTTIAEEKTGPTGEAVASVIATSNDSVKILASVNNGPIQSSFASKIIKVNATILGSSEIESKESFKKPDFGGFDPVLIMIPALIGGVIIYMKKKSK